ncbi:MAG: 5-formyltetrahydrofolate cyclo-ligase [Candidatus Melainabacteria bacterium RIFCSPLOWO2_02_FULL_35_15]|nr:MAG: 5-formyltetrahydrofolate cyclo-ligase [Candidatus Melainabacteria bacterium RIFCSPLOWO2_12_FULL_35_11]OGI14230.1 MAG: 5-formyltetrahydrofolate cyclo-ligase [Candidatus Melainabacteria bacterium RIFCSPLOWO2_02_FULL_35_15]
MDNKSEKEKLRQWTKDIRRTLDLKRISREIENKIINLDIYKSSGNVMSYLSKDIEISLDSLFRGARKKWFVPVIVQTYYGTSLKIVPYIHGRTKLFKNKFDILEPAAGNDECYDQLQKKIKLDVIFVPGLCFDKQGNRLGFGMGYYDQFLKLNPDSYKIGCCPKRCLVDRLPADEWDIKMDLVVTE